MKIMLWGGRSKARIIIEMINESIYSDSKIIGIFDKTIDKIPFKTKIQLYSDKSGFDFLCSNATHYIVCIGGEYGYARFNTSEKLKKKGLIPLDLISNHGILDKLDNYGEGIQVMPGAIVHKFASVGRQCIFNTNSTVDHECLIGDGVHIMGGASIAGRVKIGNFSTIGTNATVLPNLNIGTNVYVGAGAVVTKDVEDNLIMAGVPAKPISKNELSFDASMFQ